MHGPATSLPAREAAARHAPGPLGPYRLVYLAGWAMVSSTAVLTRMGMSSSPGGTFDDEIEIVGSDAVLRLGGIESLSFGYRSGASLMCSIRSWILSSSRPSMSLNR